jgi:hypothetical protein
MNLAKLIREDIGEGDDKLTKAYIGCNIVVGIRNQLEILYNNSVFVEIV